MNDFTMIKLPSSRQLAFSILSALRRLPTTLVLSVTYLVMPGICAATEAIPIVGYLFRGSPDEPDVCLKLFREGLAERGLSEGTHYRFSIRYAEQNIEKLEASARALAAEKPTVLIGTGVKSILLLKELAPNTPIISAGNGNMIQLGMIKSLSAPGGMITGISIGELQHGLKPLDLLHQAFPKAKKIGLVVDMTNAGIVRWVEQIRRGDPQPHGLELVPIHAITPAEIDKAFASFAKQGIRHAFIAASWMDLSPAWAKSSNGYRIATMGFYTTFVDAGGLMSVGLPSEERCRRVPRYIEQILRGAKPGDIPVEEVGNYIFSVNLKTAKKLGIRLPRDLILRADRILK